MSRSSFILFRSIVGTSRSPRIKSFAPRFLLRGVTLFGLLVLLGVGRMAQAQIITGEIDGTVKDSNGALVAGATVTVTDLHTKTVVRTLRSNDEGRYTVPLLAVGEYSLSFTADGFKTTKIDLITVDVGESVTSNAELLPGSVENSITVTASSVAPNTETPENSAVITDLQMRELALNTRNFEQILTIQPGVSYTGPDQLSSGLVNTNGAANAHSLSVNGLQPTQLSFNFDGADTLDRLTIAQSNLFPSVESIDQIKVLRDSYGAQYGGGGSAQVLIVSRAGGSQYHGDAFYFFRSQYLNANNYFNLIANPIIPRPNSHYNDFGGTAGGPVPRLRRTFFFYSQEARIIGTPPPPTQQASYPYEAQVHGYFADPVCVASGGVTSSASKCGNNLTSPQVTSSPYPGFTYQVPVSPFAQAYIKDVIQPALDLQQANSPTTANAVIMAQQSSTHSNQILGRIDRQFNDRLSGFFRYVFDPYHMVVPDGYQQNNAYPGVNTTNVYTYGENFLAHGTYVASGRTVLDFGYSILPYEIKATPVGFASASNSPDVVNSVSLPFANTTGRIPKIQINGATWGPVGAMRELNHTQQAFENTIMQLGSHTLQFGGNYEHTYGRSNPGNLNSGMFQFNSGALSGPNTSTLSFEQHFANFLQGDYNLFTQSSIDPIARISQNLYEMYVQDNWRLTPRLTLQGGVRNSMYGMPYDRAKNLGVFQPQAYQASAAPVVAGDGTECLAGAVNTTWCNGITPNPSYNSLNGIVRGGVNSPYGDAVTRRSFLNFAPRVGFALDVHGNGKTSLRGGFGIFYDQVANSIAEQEIDGSPAYVRTISYTYGTPPVAPPANPLQPAFNQSANTIPSAISGTAANWHTPYTESYSLDLQQQLALSTVLTIAYVGNKTIHLQGVDEINQPLPGEYAAVVTNAPALGQLHNANQDQYVNQVRPYRGYGPINSFDTRFFANYNGLQVGFLKAFAKARGAHITANYTWSKALANSMGFTVAPQNTYDLSPEYGPTNSDRREMFNAAAVYMLPFFRAQHGLTGKLLGGYELSAIIQAVSGTWQTATFTQQDPAGQGDIGPTSDAPERPDQWGDANHNAPHSVSQFFNTSVFKQVQDTSTTLYRPGNARVGTILGPGYQIWNVTMVRNIELKKLPRLQFRVEAFNLFNHVNFANISSLYNNPNWGEVLTARSNRELQLGAKLYF